MKIKSSTMDKVFVTCNTIFLVLFVTITLYPVLNTVALSFNDGIDAVRGGIHLWPRIFTLSNYKTVLHQQNILTGAVVSVARTVLGTIFSLVTHFWPTSSAANAFCSVPSCLCSGSSPCT